MPASQTTIPEGFPHITNFSAKVTDNFPAFAITHDADGLMLFLNRRGLTVFNGAEAHTNTFRSKLLTIKKHPRSNRIYAAGENTFGYLEKNSYFDYKYIPLIPKNSASDYYSTIIFSKLKTWFVGENSIYEVSNSQNDTTKRYYYNNMTDIRGAFFLDDKLYINLKGKGLFNAGRNGSGTFIKAADSLKDRTIVFSIPYEDKIIMATEKNRLMTFDGRILAPFPTESDEYFSESIITGAIDLNLMRFAVTTANGGAVIINKIDGSTELTINYRTGLPDDEIYAAFFDEENGLWLSHQFGTSRIMPDLPVSYYDNFPGKEGKIYDLLVKDSTLYLATGQGVYYLTEIKDFKEIEKLVTEKVRQVLPEENNSFEMSDNSSAPENKQSTTTENADKPEEEKEEKPGKLKRFWRKLTGKENETNTEESNNTDDENKTEFNNDIEPDETTENTDKPTDKSNPETRRHTVYRTVERSKKVYELQSIKYQFKKAENISGKCKQFLPYAGGIAVASNNGLFYIKGISGQLLIPDDYIYDMSYSKVHDALIVAGSKGAFMLKGNPENLKIFKLPLGDDDFVPLKTASDQAGNIFFGGNSQLSVLSYNGNSFDTEIFRPETPYPETIRPESISGKVYIFTSEQAYIYENDELKFSDAMQSFTQKNCKVYFFADMALKICNNGLVQEYGKQNNYSPTQLQMLFIESDISHITVDTDSNLWAVAANSRIFKISKHTANDSLPPLNLHITGIKAPLMKPIKNNELFLRDGFDSLAISLSAPSYFKEAEVVYHYELDEISRKLYAGDEGSKFILNSLPPGRHTLKMYAADRLNRKSQTIEYTIIVKAHFYNTPWFYALILLVLSGIIWYTSDKISKRKRRIVERYNRELEEEVERRTEKIRKQNERILEDKKKIEQQNHEITLQRQELFEHNKEMTDSIRYAQRIQTAALPEDKTLSQYFSEHFIFFKPRDMVSGDFFWLREFKNKIFIAAADCTGHGIPGGFVSMLGISFLNEIIDRPDIETDDILNQLRTKVITSLHQTKENQSRDGMDMALISIDIENMILEFSGAHNPLIVIRDKELYRIKADRMPVGFSRKKDIPFTRQKFSLKKDDIIYAFSDGFSDQFGGDHNRKFTSGRLRQLLYEIHSMSMPNQKQLLNDLFDKWRGNTLQMDDVLLIGIRI